MTISSINLLLVKTCCLSVATGHLLLYHPWDWYICLHLPLKNHQSCTVCKYTSPMDGMVIVLPNVWTLKGVCQAAAAASATYSPPGCYQLPWRSEKAEWRSKVTRPLTLQGINISHLGKRKIIFKMPFLGDMWVSWRVSSYYSLPIFWFPRADRWLMVGSSTLLGRPLACEAGVKKLRVLSPTFITNQLVDDHQQKKHIWTHGNLWKNQKFQYFPPTKMGQMCMEHLSHIRYVKGRLRDNIDRRLTLCINIINEISCSKSYQTSTSQTPYLCLTNWKLS